MSARTGGEDGWSATARAPPFTGMAGTRDPDLRALRPGVEAQCSVDGADVLPRTGGEDGWSATARAPPFTGMAGTRDPDLRALRPGVEAQCSVDGADVLPALRQ